MLSSPGSQPRPSPQAAYPPGASPRHVCHRGPKAVRANQKRSPGPLVGQFRSQRSATPGEGCGGAPRLPAAPLKCTRCGAPSSWDRPACAARTSVAERSPGVADPRRRPKQHPGHAPRLGAITDEGCPPTGSFPRSRRHRSSTARSAGSQDPRPACRSPVTAVVRARPGNWPRLLGLRVAIHPVDYLIRVVNGDLTHDSILPDRGTTRPPPPTASRTSPPARPARTRPQRGRGTGEGGDAHIKHAGRRPSQATGGRRAPLPTRHRSATIRPWPLRSSSR